MKALKQYLPALGMVLATVLGVLYSAFADSQLTLGEILALAVSLCGAVSTYIIPRLHSMLWLKTAVSGLTAALVFMVSAVADGPMTAQSWVMVAIQLLAGLGIVAVTNKNVPITRPA